jgi:hypothetical protein
MQKIENKNKERDMKVRHGEPEFATKARTETRG